MNLLLKRPITLDDRTIGCLFIENDFECFTLEDGYNEEKVYGETRIPAGKYQILLRTEGSTHESYKRRFGTDWHQGTLHLQDVPGYKWILIHIGNRPGDTLGCLLTGVGVVLSENGYETQSSTVAYKRIYPKLRDALLAGEEVWITIENC